MVKVKKIIDWDQLDRLLEAGCTGTEVAAYLGIHPETLYDRVKEKYKTDFSLYLQLKRQTGDSLLRAAQFKKALKGDNTMLVWLGKNRLKQREKDVGDENPDDIRKIAQFIASLSSASEPSQPKVETEQPLLDQRPPGDQSPIQA